MILFFLQKILTGATHGKGMSMNTKFYPSQILMRPSSLQTSPVSPSLKHIPCAPEDFRRPHCCSERRQTCND